MVAGLDLLRLYSQSGPALTGVVIVVAVLAWKDCRRLFKEVKEDASDASATAEEAKAQAETAMRETNRHELLLDEVATDVEELADVTAQNDKRIARIRERQAARWGADFQRGGSAAQDANGNGFGDPIDADDDADRSPDQTANAPREESN